MFAYIINYIIFNFKLLLFDLTNFNKIIIKYLIQINTENKSKKR